MHVGDRDCAARHFRCVGCFLCFNHVFASKAKTASEAKARKERATTKIVICRCRLSRRFPPLWSVEDIGAAFVVIDSGGQKLAYVYYEDGKAWEKIMSSSQKLMQVKRYWEARRKHFDQEIVKARRLRAAAPTGRQFFNTHLKTLMQLAAMCRKMAKSTQRAIDDA